MKKLIIILIILSMISLVYATDTCPDYRLGGANRNSGFMCGGVTPDCINANENNTLCNSPSYTCEGVSAGGVNYNGEDFTCNRCNTEDGYRGRVPYCVKEGEEYEGEGEDSFNQDLTQALIPENNIDVLLARRNIGNVRVFDYSDIRCCAEEGEIPTGEFGRCCNGMPTEGANGACGCPSGFVWNPVLNQGQGACAPGGQICWSSDANERTDIGKCLAQELTVTFLLNNLFMNNQYDSNILDCFAPRPNQENPRQACCPYVTYDNKDYGEYQNIEVY